MKVAFQLLLLKINRIKRVDKLKVHFLTPKGYGLHKKDLALLQNIKLFFGVGGISKKELLEFNIT